MKYPLLSFLFVFWPTAWGANQRPSVVLISVDTLRADRLGCYGYKAIITPHIDAITSGGTRFTSVSSQVPLTLPSHVSLLTSTYPFSNGIRDNGQTLDVGAVTLATTLKAQGYRTGAFIASYVLDRRFGLSQGFDEYNESFDLDQPNSSDPGNVKRPGDDVVQAATAWLGRNSQKPFFLFLHLYDLHTPYRIPGRSGQLTYDAMLSYEDGVIGRFWDSLARQGLIDRALIVFTADHGEGLGDHSEKAHGYFAYQSTLRVPVMMHWPRGTAFPPTTDEPAGLIDIAPTIIDYLGLPRPREFQGRSLMGSLRGRLLKSDVYSESVYAHNHFGCSALLSLTDGKYKYIESTKPELYDLSRDPREQNNLYSSQRALADGYRARIRALITRYRSPAAAQKQQPGSEAMARLRSLGYLGGTSGATGSLLSGPAPAERISAWETYDRASASASSGRISEGIAMMEQMLAKMPDLADVRLSLGLLLQQEGRHADAASQFRELLKREPANPIAHFDLGISLQAMAQNDDAWKEFEAALALDPTYIRAEEALSGQLLHRRRFDEARTHYEHILNVDPGNFGAHYNLGALAASREKWDDAKAQLEAALRANPRSAESHNVLGSICLRQGDLTSAGREFREAIQLSPGMSMAHYNLGLVLRKQGDTGSAAQEFRAALEFDPANQAARAALSASQ